MRKQTIRPNSSRGRRAAAVAAAVIAAGGGAAVAEAAFEPGTYEQGAVGEGLSAYGKATFKTTRFDVKRITLPLVCRGGGSSHREEFSFIKGSDAKLSGAVSSTGKFSGVFRQSNASVRVSGRIQGETAKMTVRMAVDVSATTTERETDCRDKHTFRLRRIGS